MEGMLERRGKVEGTRREIREGMVKRRKRLGEVGGRGEVGGERRREHTAETFYEGISFVSGVKFVQGGSTTI